METNKLLPWFLAALLGAGNMGQIIDRAVTQSRLQGSIQFGDSLLLTIGEYAKECGADVPP